MAQSKGAEIDALKGTVEHIARGLIRKWRSAVITNMMICGEFLNWFWVCVSIMPYIFASTMKA